MPEFPTITQYEKAPIHQKGLPGRKINTAKAPNVHAIQNKVIPFMRTIDKLSGYVILTTSRDNKGVVLVVANLEKGVKGGGLTT